MVGVVSNSRMRSTTVLNQLVSAASSGSSQLRSVRHTRLLPLPAGSNRWVSSALAQAPHATWLTTRNLRPCFLNKERGRHRRLPLSVLPNPRRALPCLTTPSRAVPCPAMPSHARSVSLYYSSPALPNHARPGLDFHALLRQTMPYLGLFDFFDIRFSEPTEHTAFFRTPVPDPDLAAGNVQPLKQLA